MIFYTLRIEVPTALGLSYEKWLREHAQRVTDQPGFIGSEILVGESQEKDKTLIFNVRYGLDNIESFHRYLKGPAQQFRKDGEEKFGTNIRIQRDVVHLKYKLSHKASDQ